MDQFFDNIEHHPLLGNEYTEYGYGMFPNDPHLPSPPPPIPRPCPPGQEFIPPHGCLYPCTLEQLTRDGYRPPNPLYPPHPKDPNPESKIEQEIQRTYEPNISIRCLQPSPLPPPEELTIIEIRPPRLPTPPPIVDHGPRPPTPRAPSPITIREHPPPKPRPRSKEICYVKLPPPPAPPRQRITHIYNPPPAKPRDIIIERWLPYTRQLPDPHAKKIIHPPPYNPRPVRDLIIQHIHPKPLINRQIQKVNPCREDPEKYERQYGSTLIHRDNLLQTVLRVLSQQHVEEHIVRRIRAIFRVQCNDTREPLSPTATPVQYFQ